MPLNYVTKAIEGLHTYRNFSKLPNIDKMVLQEVIDLLDKSVKFDLPANADLIGKDQMKKILNLDIFKLPFPITALQYSADYSETTEWPEDRRPSPKRVALCVELKELKASGLLRTLIKKAMPWLENNAILTIALTSQEFEPRMPEFTPVMFMTLTPLDLNIAKEHPEIAFMEVAEGIHSILVPLMPALVQSYMQKRGPKEALHNGWTDIIEEHSAMAEFMCTLACNNVSTVTEYANEKLNKKRAKNGKTPLYDSRLITIKLSKSSRTTEATSDKEKRASPRSHLRRGHIRHLQSGKLTWIPVTVIGADPSAPKDYMILR